VASKIDEAKAEDRLNDVQEALTALKLASRKKVERLMKADEIHYSHAKKCFVYSEEPEKVFDTEIMKKLGDDDYDDEDDHSVSGEDNDETKLENVGDELDAIGNENIENKVVEMLVKDSKKGEEVKEESKQIEETTGYGDKIPLCKRQHFMKAKMCLPDCYIGKFDSD